MIDLLAPHGRRPPSYLSKLRSCWRAAKRPGEQGLPRKGNQTTQEKERSF